MKEMNRGQEKGFLKFPIKLLYDNSISDRAKILCTVLIDKADSHGCAILTLEEMRQLIYCESERTVRRAEEELCNAGYIQIIKTGRASMIWLSSDIVTGSPWSALEWYEAEQRRKEIAE